MGGTEFFKKCNLVSEKKNRKNLFSSKMNSFRKVTDYLRTDLEKISSYKKKRKNCNILF